MPRKKAPGATQTIKIGGSIKSGRDTNINSKVIAAEPQQEPEVVIPSYTPPVVTNEPKSKLRLIWEAVLEFFSIVIPATIAKLLGRG